MMTDDDAAYAEMNKEAELRELARIEHLLNEAEGPDDRAYAYLSLGVFCERREDWNVAVDSYSKAIAAESQRVDFRYFSNNNLGYSRIQLSQFDEAEGFCLEAIEVNACRHNAHKNLGLVRQGQKRWLEAAFCFIEAYSLCPSDARAWHLLSALFNLHPELLAQSADLRAAFIDLGSNSPGHYMIRQ